MGDVCLFLAKLSARRFERKVQASGADAAALLPFTDC